MTDLSLGQSYFVDRLLELMDAGYPLKCAEQIALRPEITLREAERLIDEGVPPETAVRSLL